MATAKVQPIRHPQMRHMADPEIERVVIWHMLTVPDAYARISELLQADDFTLRPHQILYRAAGELYSDGVAPSLETVPVRLHEQAELETVGGLAAIVEMGDGVPRLARVDSYCRLLRRMAIQRRSYSEAEQIRLMVESGELDAAEQLEAASQRIRDMQAALEESATEETLFGAVQSAGGIEKLFAKPERVVPVEWPGLRKLLPPEGFVPGQLVILAGRPGNGKSTVLEQMAIHAAIHGQRTKIFSLEMSRAELLTRLCAYMGHVDHSRLIAGHASAAERAGVMEQLSRYEDIPLGIEDRAMDLDSIIRAMERAKRRGSPYHLVGLDYLQITDSGKHFKNRAEELSYMTRRLKLAAKEYGAVLVALSQLNRDIEKRGSNPRPQLSDLRESGSIEQDADVVIFTHRPELYKPDDASLRNLAELILGKQRNGPTGTVRLNFWKNYCCFTEEAEQGRDYDRE